MEGMDANHGDKAHHVDVDVQSGTETLVWEKHGAIHISTKAMSIAWASDNRFWESMDLPNDDFKEKYDFATAVELKQVSCLEVVGSVDLAKLAELSLSLSHEKTYEIVYHIKFKVDAFGWQNLPVTFALFTPDEQTRRSEVLESRRGHSNQWHEVHGNDFKGPKTTTGKLSFGMFETSNQKWKGGMILAGVTIRAKN
ncbi:protein PHLOEM PROTEIN 2-LIKE A2-like isoform X2 [Zingiber officinale]|uniref:Uncharacterized protein n=1 Tax=Zingiber officinale TaxID=94328 RepID=A0A8J5GTE5_ZINOF|nr:protein PHLOEM PROTEIN 2-LIKE A2-like isoform X2 [Zingiber officinale]KAG6509506.1 hypothetical protein ZIOFF_027499 [Zingiber officinale]